MSEITHKRDIKTSIVHENERPKGPPPAPRKVTGYVSIPTEEYEQLKRDLWQQRFNNKHNLSIDQKVSDELSRLKQENEDMKFRLDGLEK